jgi:hypothetical protein
MDDSEVVLERDADLLMELPFAKKRHWGCL